MVTFVCMKAEVGNKVKVLNENYEGIIKELLYNNRLIVTCTDGFDYEVSINEIVIVNDDDTHHYIHDENVISEKIIKDVVFNKSKPSYGILSKYIATTKFQYEKILEVDLHLEELVEFPQRLDDWQKLHTQMQHLKKCLNAAFDENIKNIVFIHGVGTGVLKTEIHNFLADYDNLVIKEADFREYGSGATEVIVKH
jgi:Smr domain